MMDRICEAQHKFLDLIEIKIDERGLDRVDVDEMGELADIVKDLAEAIKYCHEAEYYRLVAHEMADSGGVEEAHDDTIEAMRHKFQAALPDERERIRRELLKMVG